MTDGASQEIDKLGPEEEFHRRLSAGTFYLQKCGACAAYIFYPRMICPECGGDELEWVPASGKGSVYSTSVIRQKPERGGDYNFAVIQLAEGPRMVSRVENIPPQDVAIDMAVQARITEEDQGPYVVFDLAAGEA